MKDFAKTMLKDPGTQIDLIYRRSDKVLVLCEIKYSKKKISKDILLDIEKKVERLKIFKGHTIEKALISVCGIDEILRKKNYFDYVVTLEDILS